MKLSLPIQTSISDYYFIASLWSLLLLIVSAFLLFLDLELSILLKLLIIVFILSLGFLHLWLHRRQLSQFERIYWDGDNWYLLVEGQKKAISLLSGTRVLMGWVLLSFRFNESRKVFNHQLLLSKNTLGNKNYRDLCRTLRFLPTGNEQTK